MVNGPEVVNVLTIETSARAEALAPLPVLSVLLPRFGSPSFAETVALLSKEPAALIVAVTVTVALEPTPSEAMVHGSAAQPPPVTLVMVRFAGVSVICTFVAGDGPLFVTCSEYWIDWPWKNGP